MTELSTEKDYLLENVKPESDFDKICKNIPEGPNKPEYEYKCGWFGWAPSWLQVFNTPVWALFFLGLAAFVQGAIVNGMLHFFISTIEKRFEMPSYQSGLMSGAFDIASLLCLIPVTYFGGRRHAHKPRYIATGILIVGIGSVIFFIPHFLGGKHKVLWNNDICIPNLKETTTEFSRRHITTSSNLNETVTMNSFSVYFWILFIGNFLHGLGGTPLFTLCITFLDEAVPEEKSSLYIGCYYFMALLGPAVGFALGGMFIRLYVDFPFMSMVEIGMFPDNPSWVGCWWIGFVITSLLAILVAFLIYGMPKEIRYIKDDSEIHEYIEYQTLKELPKAICHLISNATYMCICLVACCEGLLLAGFGAFMPKILEKEYNLGPTTVALIMGTVALPSALVGLLMGGWLVKFFKMDLKSTMWFDIVCTALSLLCVPGLLIGCPQDTIVGVNHPYFENRMIERARYNLVSFCNYGCHCPEEIYSPICGQDNMQYFSACYAGCQVYSTQKDHRTFYNCPCIPKSVKWIPGSPEATSLPCQIECPFFPLFIFLFFLYQTFTFTAAVPAISAMLRVVNVNLKSLAMGIQWILSRLLGTIPGPVLFGSLMDQSCLFWHSSQYISKGVCLLYNHKQFRFHLAAITAIWKVLQILFFCLALIFSSRENFPASKINPSSKLNSSTSQQIPHSSKASAHDHHNCKSKD